MRSPSVYDHALPSRRSFGLVARIRSSVSPFVCSCLQAKRVDGTGAGRTVWDDAAAASFGQMYRPTTPTCEDRVARAAASDTPKHATKKSVPASQMWCKEKRLTETSWRHERP